MASQVNAISKEDYIKAEKIKADIEKIKAELVKEETRLAELEKKKAAALDRIAQLQGEKDAAVVGEDFIRAAVSAGRGWAPRCHNPRDPLRHRTREGSAQPTANAHFARGSRR